MNELYFPLYRLVARVDGVFANCLEEASFPRCNKDYKIA